MNTFNSAFVLSDLKTRWCFRSFVIVISLICGAYTVGNAFIAKEYKGRLAPWGVKVNYTMQNINSTAFKSQCRPSGSEALPEGIVAEKSNLEMWPLWDSGEDNRISKPSLNLLAIAVGIKQKEVVNKIVEKFPSNDFVVMLFHYDGLLDGWRNFSWSDGAIHVSAINQTKWWFAKRFLHPDIVADYNYIFLWDEDLGVENFDPKRYLSIVEEEGLEISQPALDCRKSEVHHQLTARRSGSKVHRVHFRGAGSQQFCTICVENIRRYYKLNGSGRCDDHSTAPPCIGWVEMMAPVFSKKSWPCVWHMIQNDLVHAWGLDKQLGYCAQGDRTRNVGIIDSEYIVHFGLPTLGGSNRTEDSHSDGARAKVRMQSYMEMQIFRRRWNDAVKKDKSWIDPYGQKANQISH